MDTVVLLSGGLDSIALTYWLRPRVAITFDYGQVPAAAELHAAHQVCLALDLTHEVIRIDCSGLGSGDLCGRPALTVSPVPEWWPFRNQLLITLASMRAIALNVHRLIIGTVASDDCHADGRPAFVEAIAALVANQEGALRVEAPAIGLSSEQLIRRACVPAEVLAWAHSCHVSNLACGYCRGCHKHYDTMGALGIGPY
jgi:7-cyano-7-deazaguanine synthase